MEEIHTALPAAFGVHGIGGATGALLTGVFARPGFSINVNNFYK